MTTEVSPDYANTEHGKAFAAMAAGLPTGCYIGGEWRPSSDGSVIAVADPSYGETFARVANGTVGDATLAVDAASAAMPAWASTAPRVPRRSAASGVRADDPAE